MIKHLGLNRAADGLLNNQDKFQQFKDIANRRNYPYKVKKLQERITEEHDFWSKKNPSQKLLDIKKDLTFIQ